MTDRDFEIGGRKFKLCKIDAFKQFHIVRRIGPLLSDLMPIMQDAQKLKAVESLSESEKFEMIAKFVGPIMNGLSKLSDADSELVLFGLLASVEVQQMPAGNWARVSSNSMLMIQDMELPMLLQIAGRAFVFNLAGFFGALPPKS
jgi:hypothetical protein